MAAAGEVPAAARPRPAGAALGLLHRLRRWLVYRPERHYMRRR